MGKPVTVDSDDLEKIIMITGIAKDMEKLIRKQKDDPFLCKDDAVIKEAHDRLATEWRRVTREMNPDADTPVSAKALNLLKSLEGKICHIEPATIRLPLYKELHLKLMTEYGSGYQVVYWGSSQTQQRLNDVEHIMLRVTERGRKLLNDVATKEQSTVQ